MLIPIAVIVLFSFNDPSGNFNIAWQGFTLDHWRDPFADQALDRRAGHEPALRSIDCAARAYKAGQKLAPRAANVSVSVTTRKIGGGLGSPFGPAGPGGPAGPAAPCGPGGHVRHWVPPTLVPCLALRALRSDGARWAEGPAPPRSPTKPCGPTGSLQTLSTLRTRRSDEPLRASFAQRPGRTSPPSPHDCNPPWVTRAVHWEQRPLPDVRLGLAECRSILRSDHARRVPRTARVVQPKVGRTCLVTPITIDGVQFELSGGIGPNLLTFAHD